MKASELRQSILQAAVQGKLVPQDSYDEPASVLLERISAEKSKLVKEGKIKKEKPLPPIAENEVPYDLPEGWVWCRLGDLSSVQSSKRVFTSEFVNKGIPFFRGTEIGALATGQEKTPKYYITQKHYADLIQHTGKPIIGDLLMPSICPDGRIWLVDTNKPFYFKDGRVLWVRIIENCVNNRYIQQALKARLISDYVNIASGTTFAELKIFLLKEIVIPLPPLSEQHRIVSKVADLMSLCDKLEAAENELETLEDHFIEYLPKSILQLAVQGKLVSQNLHEEPASELLTRIRAEKAQLIKEGKIKKEKPLPPIAEDEAPYDLPEGWVWCRLGDAFIVNPRNQLDDSIDVTFTPMSLISSEYFGGHEQETRKWGDVKSGFTHYAENDVAVAKITPCFQNGKSCVMKNLVNGFGAGTTELHILRCIEVLPEYLLIFVKNPFFLLNGEMNMTGTAGQRRVPTNYLKSLLLPLPALAEQRRIVAKVAELMELCDELKAAKNMPVKRAEGNVVALPQRTELEEGIGIAARGDATQPYSPKLQDTINKLFKGNSHE